MLRAHVLLLEDDVALRDVLIELFREEEVDVTLCASLPELRAGLVVHPEAVVVSDSWLAADTSAVGSEHRAEIVALGKIAPVILATGRTWARDSLAGEFGASVVVLSKPYDIDSLMTLVRSRAAANTEDHLARTLLRPVPGDERRG